MQNNKIVIALIVVILILVGYIFWNRPSSPETPSGQTEVATTTTTGGTAPKSTTTSTTQPTTKPSTTTTTKPPTVSMTKDGLYIINYTDRGFSPTMLTLTKGKGVHFVNNSNKALRVFSDLPNDRIYGAITQSKTIGKGGTYDFTFNDVGNWGYYNANYPSHRGTVVVTEK